MSRTRGSATALLVAACAMATDAHATSSCSSIALTPCSFPNYTGTRIDTTGTLTFNCTTNDTPITFTLSAGSGTEANRVFSGGAGFQYQIYLNAARTNYFGTTSGHTAVFTPVVGANTFIFYCRLPAATTPPAGSYADAGATLITPFLSAGNNVFGTVAGTCSTFSTTTQLVFGAYDPIVTNAVTPRDATGTFSVNCTNHLRYTVTANQGTHAAGGSTNATPLRQMQSGANLLRYDVYQDAARSIVLGNTAATGLSIAGTGAAQASFVYGRIGAGQNKPSGSYSDTVIMTVTF